MKKRISALLLSACLFLHMLPAAGAGFVDIPDPETAVAAAALQGLGIVSGTGAGTFEPDGTLTRSQICAMVVRAMGLSDQVNTHARKTLFSDVAPSAWYNGYINLAYAQGIINGYGDGTFGPEDPITYGQLATILLRMLGYTTAEIGSVWPLDYTRFCDNLELSEGLALEPGQALTRGETAILFYRALKADANGKGKPYYMTINGVHSSAEVLLLDADTSYGGKSGLLKTCSLDSGAEAVYYAQARPQGDVFVGMAVTLLLNSGGEAVGTIPLDTDSPDSRVTSSAEVILLDTDATHEGTGGLLKAVPLDGSAGILYYPQVNEQSAARVDTVVTLLLDGEGQVMGMLPGSQTYLDTGIVSQSRALLLDVNASQGEERGLLTAYQMDGSPGVVSYAQAVPQQGALTGTVVTLLFNGGGKVVGTIPESVSHRDVEIGSATAASLTDGDGKSYRISSGATVISSGESYPYGTSGYLRLNAQAGKTVRLFYDNSGAISYLYLAGGTASGSEAAVAATTSAASSLSRDLGISGKDYTITKNGVTADASALAQYDVGYYDAASSTLRVSDYRVTGYLSAASPSVSAAETLTLAGHTFDVLECAWDTLKAFDMSDKVTLLLTDDGKVAAAYSASQLPADMVGVLAKDGRSVTLAGSGITLSASTMNYTEDDLGALVTVSVSSGSTINCGAVSGAASGMLDITNYTVGEREIAPSCAIYEWAGKGYVYDLEGDQGMASSNFSAIAWSEKLSSSYVSYTHTNSAGQIDVILLKDVTGSAYDYGRLQIIKDSINLGGGNLEAYNDAATLTNSSGATSKHLYALSGAGGYVGVAFGQSTHGYGRVVKVQSLHRLTGISAEDFFQLDGDWYAEAGNSEYPISEHVEILVSGADLWLGGESGLTSVLADGYDLTLYYDREPSEGGQVRIILASSGG